MFIYIFCFAFFVNEVFNNFPPDSHSWEKMGGMLDETCSPEYLIIGEGVNILWYISDRVKCNNLGEFWESMEVLESQQPKKTMCSSFLVFLKNIKFCVHKVLRISDSQAMHYATFFFKLMLSQQFAILIFAIAVFVEE